MANTRRTRSSRTAAQPVANTCPSTAGDPTTAEGGADAEPWTVERIRALGATTDLRTAGAIFGLSANTAYDLARRGGFPVEVIRVGAQYRVSVPAILTLLHAGTGPADPQPRPDPGS
jgi:hypothetical protein